MYVEDQIIAMREQRGEAPFGWLICFENRPLQGIPPKKNGAHLLFFSEEKSAQTFITDRKMFFGEEPLSVVRVDSPDTLKSMALNPCGDTRYAAPPCGIVLDFNYSTAKPRKVISPADVKSMLPVEFAGALGSRARQPRETGFEPARQAQKIEPESKPGQKRTRTSVLITCGALLVVGLLSLCIGGVWFGLRRGAIPAQPLLHTATFTNAPTITPTPTASSTPTATPVAWKINVEDGFISNTNGWPVGSDRGQYGNSNLAIQNGKLVFEMEAVENCWFWWYPDIASVADFDVAVNVQRAGGSTSGDYGITLRTNGDNNSFYYFGINDTNQEFAFFIYQNDNWTKILDWTDATAIMPDKINRIEVNASGAYFTFSVNGTVVGQAKDARLSSGRLGILAELYDSGDKIKVEYDNLVLRGNP
jgi:hypothetical protein